MSGGSLSLRPKRINIAFLRPEVFPPLPCMDCRLESSTDMNSKRLKRKRFAPADVKSRFPRLVAGKSYIGIFDGHSVSVIDKTGINNIYNEGNFGKGSLSKSAPTYDPDDDVPAIIMQQQLENQLKWGASIKTSAFGHSQKDTHKTCIYSVQNFLDSAISGENNSWKQWKAMNHWYNTYQGASNAEKSVSSRNLFVDNSLKDNNDMNPNDPLFHLVDDIIRTGKIREPNTSNQDKVLVIKSSSSGSVERSSILNTTINLMNKEVDINEVLKLNLTEAFFLSFVLKCLKILDKSGNEISINDLWSTFNKSEEGFISKYIAYHQYRACGWTVRSGLKFGGDYLLYKMGPAYYHASYLVWIMDKKRKKMTWCEYAALNRLTETYNKDLILCQVTGPDNAYENGPDGLRKFEILEMMSKRWVPAQEREMKKS